MALTRAHEEHEVAPDLRKLYGEVRSAFDLPFVPTLFKLLAGAPDYLQLLWSDLGHVARSREFQNAAHALEELARSHVVHGGWRFSDGRRFLAGQKFSSDDLRAVAALPPIFSRNLAQMALFARLLQRGYAGGQRGRVSEARQAAALSRLLTLHVPNERDASLRVWLIYSDIKKTTGARSVLSMYRVLSPFPGYLASVWLDSKKVLGEASFLRSREEFNRRVSGLLVGLPVKDHHAASRAISPAQWRDIEETVDGFARLLPQFLLISLVWERSVGYAAQRAERVG